MTRTTKRAKTINKLRKVCRERLSFRQQREALSDNDSLEDAVDADIAAAFQQACSIRYHQKRGPYRKASDATFYTDFGWLLRREQGESEDEPDGEPPWLNEDEFRQKYRMSKDAFSELYNLIKDDVVFRRHPFRRGRKPAHPAFQLAVLLKFLGTEGSGNSNPELRNVFRIGRGTAKKYRDTALKAVRRLRDKVYTWPDEEERKVIAKRIAENFDWPNCIGIMDGTLFPLAFEPETEDAPDYSGRKHAYSITCLIICDDQRLIRYALCGWPGTTHDERVFRNSKIARLPDKFLSQLQYIIGDTAFECNWYCVSSYRKPAGGTIPYEFEQFNCAMKELRVISEHTIGILKGRFPMLRNIRMKIRGDGKKGVKNICEYVEGAIILHNLLTKRNEEEPDAWLFSDDNSDMFDPARGLTEEEVAQLYQPIPHNAPPDERRRQLTGYHSIRHVMNH